jgi:hypothetical protein
MTKQELINDIISNFDWEKVSKVMKSLDWKWFSSRTENQVPSIGEMLIVVTDLLNRSYDGLVRKYHDKTYGIATGGFEATAHRTNNGEIWLQLSFVASQAFNYIED